MESTYEMSPVGIVRSTRDIPEDDHWDTESSRIDLLEPFDARATRGLEEFSHCLVVYVFDRTTWDVSRMSRHPRGNKDWPEVGIFAQRAKDRPNRIGITVSRILKVENGSIHVAGLDAIDGTPVLDVKPHMEEFSARGEVRQPPWSRELMSGYW